MHRITVGFLILHCVVVNDNIEKLPVFALYCNELLVGVLCKEIVHERHIALIGIGAALGYRRWNRCGRNGRLGRFHRLGSLAAICQRYG